MTTVATDLSGLLLAPGWEVVGAGDRVGGLAFGTGEELIVWGGRAPDANEETIELLSGIAWEHDTGISRALPSPPFAACRGFSSAVWTGTELVLWFRPTSDPRCTGPAVAAYEPASGAWRQIDAAEFAEAGASAVWGDGEILAWRQGLALDPFRGSVRAIEAWDVERTGSSNVRAHWTGEEVLVLADTRLRKYEPAEDRWTDLPPPPIGAIAQDSVWTGTHLLAVNYQMEAALFDPETATWTGIEPMPLRFMESLPFAFGSDELTMVRMAVGSAVLDGTTWVSVPDSLMVAPWSPGFPTLADGWLYEVGETVLRRPAPVLAGDGMQTEPAIPLQTMLLEIPETWTASLIGSETTADLEHLITYQLVDDDDGRSCDVAAHHGGEPDQSLVEASVIRSWDGARVGIKIGPDQSLAVVDDSFRTSDWVEIRCDSPEAAQMVATHIWVSP
ncbi:MAG TPA: hypothetical protein VIA81_06840 [Acidimicrobiia bacterium]